MKTKNLFLTALFVATGILYVNSAKAQDQVNLNLILKPIASITVLPSAKDVNLVYDNLSKYQNGVDYNAVKQLNVVSTGKFEVNVKANAEFTSNPSASGKPLVSTISLSAKTNGASDGKGKVINQLSTGEQQLYISQEGTSSSGIDIDVTYTGDKNLSYLNKNYFSSNNASGTTFATVLTYSLIAN